MRNVADSRGGHRVDNPEKRYCTYSCRHWFEDVEVTPSSRGMIGFWL